MEKRAADISIDTRAPPLATKTTGRLLTRPSASIASTRRRRSVMSFQVPSSAEVRPMASSRV